jgi:hypothetical protein
MKTRIWSFLALLVTIELAVIVTHQDEMRAMARSLYQTLWRYAPKPDGYVPPDRFAPRSSESSTDGAPSR